MFENVKNRVDYLMKENSIPYMDVCVFKEKEEIFRYYTGEGVNGKEKLFLFSCTKPITVVTAMKLVENGKMSLDDPVEKYLPEYKNIFVEDKEGNLFKNDGKMTVKHLFTMSAGLTYDLGLYPVEQAEYNIEDKSKTLKIIDTFTKKSLKFIPGERYQYSLCHDVLGGVVEAVSGKKLSAVMKESIFDPLDMKETYFANQTDDSVLDLYMGVSQRNVVKIKKENPYVFANGYESGGAGLISTVNDYAKLACALANGGVGENGNRIISEKSIAKIIDLNLANEMFKKGFVCAQGEGYGYGLGVRVRIKETDWGLPVGEFGWDGAAASYLMVDPINKVSIVIGMHVRSWTAWFGGEHLNIVKEVYKNLQL